MNDIVLEASVVNVEPQTDVIVDAVSDAEAVVLDAVVRLENNEFVLSSGGMYGGGALIGSIPAWVLEAISQELTTGDGNISSLVSDLQTALDALETGVNQSISNLESDVLSQSGLITSLRSDVDGNNATIMNVLATKVTEAQASAVALSAIQSTFGADAEAFVSNIASTYVDADSAIATEIDMMQASLNGVNASITDISSITIETVQNPLWIDDGIGTDPDINDEPRWIDQAKAKKQLEVNADGVITGLLLESGQIASITMQADEFKLVASDQTAAVQVPFTVNAITGEIAFNGKVSLAGLGIDSDTTTIDGGKITANSVTVNQINTSGLTADYINSASEIVGNIIRGVQIYGAVIKASYFDWTSSGDLTNWRSVTDINTIPAEYRANFAKDNLGNYIIASGYYVLAGTQLIMSNSEYAIGINAVWPAPSVYSYNNYYVSSVYRMLAGPGTNGTNTLIATPSSTTTTLRLPAPDKVYGFTTSAAMNGFKLMSFIIDNFDKDDAVTYANTEFIIFGTQFKIEINSGPNKVTSVKITKNGLLIFNTQGGEYVHYNADHTVNGLPIKINAFSVSNDGGKGSISSFEVVWLKSALNTWEYSVYLSYAQLMLSKVANTTYGCNKAGATTSDSFYWPPFTITYTP